MTEVWKSAPYKQSDLLILLALADSANDEGVCWPSVATLARRGRVKDRQVRKVLSRLEDDGWLRRAERAGRSTVYTVTVPEEERSHRTTSSTETVPQDHFEGGNGPTGPGVPQDRGVLQDRGGVSSRTGGGVPQDTQNHKEPSSEPSSSSSSVERSEGSEARKPTPIATGPWQPRWSPSSSSAQKMLAAYGEVLTVMQMKMIADDLYEWTQKNKKPDLLTDRMFESFVKNEVERLAKAERDEARAAREERKPGNPYFE